MLLGDPFAAQRGHLSLWVPVALACGVGSYFSLPSEPDLVQLYCATGLVILLFGTSYMFKPIGPVLAFAGLVLAGGLLMTLRTQNVAAPVLEYRSYNQIEGRLIAVDRSLSDVPRLTFDQFDIAELDGPMPARIRISLHGAVPSEPLTPGMRLRLTANVSPPSGPVEPGGFDFQRYAWFARIGGVGYSRSDIEILSSAEDGLWVVRLRQTMSAYLQSHLPGETGAFAAAILAGERSAIPRERLDDLRGSNLAHLLAISGLHMGLLTGFVFALTRAALSLWPAVGLRVNAKKIAAVVALLAAAGYLVLSGANIATKRAFIMVAVMLVAVLWDRRAITLRSVAVAAVIVLLIEPESLVEPGFQMSFSATTALVAIFGALRDWPGHWPQAPKWTRPILATVLSSLVAGLATAPFSAAHFNQIAQYGLLANLLAVPTMGLVVIPSAVLGLVLAPFGLGQIGFTVMGWGINWILFVASWVSSLNGAIWPVPTPPEGILGLIAIGSLWLVLWRGRGRFAGSVPCLAAFGLWMMAERPVLLIADSGGLIGVMTPEGRALSKARGDGFAARSWLENDGDIATPQVSFDRMIWGGEQDWLETDVLGRTVVQLKGRGWKDRLDEACHRADWLVVAQWVRSRPNGKCTLLDRRTLSRTGAIAVYDEDGMPKFRRANDGRHGRPWSQ